ncbi:MAG: four helix bundle protein [Bacteroidetes bacterium]|nr:four helix bundle protein [Bacteroidota bacterium]
METDSDKIPTFFRFEDLRIYNKALEYIEWVHNIVKAIPEDSMLGLSDKFITSAQNIAMNIAEGSSRNKSQFVYYLKMAKSSVRECVVFTSICKGLGYLSEDSVDNSRNHLMEMTKMLGALIGSLQKSQGGPGDDND